MQNTHIFPQALNNQTDYLKINDNYPQNVN